ncbi:MAG: bifunctional acetate--CoA ligase family protein/GNAT family N-acetyltransferase, partial [Nitrososphaerota archaeon]
AYPSVKKIPWQVDLAIVATPAHIVPQIVEECGEAGITGIIIVSSGFGETDPKGKALEEELSKLKRTYGLRIIGPNCLGVMRPSIRLNATFANRTAMPGRIAFVSQSGALCASVLDWAAQANVGFSCFVSVGGMIDVDFADLIDYFGIDPETRSIILFIEAIKDPRKFMSAARRFAGTKPIIVVKAGKSPEGAKAAASHTGAIAGEDLIYNAFFQRAGIVRVEEISDLFNCSEILAMQPPPKGPRLAILTNAGGPGVMATDALVARGGRLATLNEDTIRALDKILPHYWSRSNPVDICEDATVERFRKVLEICFRDPNADGYLVIYTPIGAADPSETARILVEVSKDSDKPILASWLGEEDVRDARNILRKNKIPACSTPEQAVATFVSMYQYARNLELLYETPEELPLTLPADRRRLQEILEAVAKEGRKTLTEPESKEFLEAYGIQTARAYIARTQEEAVTISSRIGFPVAMKILSTQLTHKSDVGGVVLNVASESQVRRCFEELIERSKRIHPPIKAEGVTVQPMIFGGYELIIGSKRDPQFGSVIIFGTGGVGVEVFNDIAVGFPPLNQTLARRMIEQTRAYKILSEGFRGRPPVDIRLLEETLIRFSQLIVDFPQIIEADVNPLLVDDKSVVALDARIVIDSDKLFAEVQPFEHLIIRPYPRKYVAKRTLRDGKEVTLRPIKPEDEPLLVELFKTFSEETMRLRFFEVIREISHKTLARYCNIDYDREMSIVAEMIEDSKRRVVGMVRLVVQPDGESGEVAVVVGDPWQNRGLGSMMLDYIIEIGKDMRLKRIFGEILAENTKMMHICYTRGFETKPVDEETYLATLDLEKGKP